MAFALNFALKAIPLAVLFLMASAPFYPILNPSLLLGGLTAHLILSPPLQALLSCVFVLTISTPNMVLTSLALSSVFVFFTSSRLLSFRLFDEIASELESSLRRMGPALIALFSEVFEALSAGFQKTRVGVQCSLLARRYFPSPPAPPPNLTPKADSPSRRSNAPPGPPGGDATVADGEGDDLACAGSD